MSRESGLYSRRKATFYSRIDTFWFRETIMFSLFVSLSSKCLMIRSFSVNYLAIESIH